MYTLSMLIIATLVALIIGGLIGTAITKSMQPNPQEHKDLEARLKQAETKLQGYQQEVSDHFSETSLLVNRLTHSYKEVHEHLANSALKLSNSEVSRQLIDAGDGTLLETIPEDAPDEELAEAPKDWAPKQPGDAGQLSEDFGLAEDEKEKS